MRFILQLLLTVIICSSCGSTSDLTANKDFQKRKYLKGRYSQSVIEDRKNVEILTSNEDDFKANTPTQKDTKSIESIVKARNLAAQPVERNQKKEAKRRKRVNKLLEKHLPFIEPLERDYPNSELRSGAIISEDEREDNMVGIVGFALAIVTVIALLAAGVAGGSIAGVIAALTGIASFVLGITALRDFKDEPNRYKGRGFALTAFIIGLIYLIFIVLAIVLIAILFSDWSR